MKRKIRGKQEKKKKRKTSFGKHEEQAERRIGSE